MDFNIMNSKKNGFRFLLSITPKEGIDKYSREDITLLLGLNPTSGHKIGDTTSWNENKKFSYWCWEYGSNWIPFWLDENTTTTSFSDSLLDFLKSLPPDESIWENLSEYCDYHLYIPIERDYFLIEVEFENSIWEELRFRKLNIHLSSLTKMN